MLSSLLGHAAAFAATFMSAPAAPSPFAGSWSGTVTIGTQARLEQTLEVSASGMFTGTFLNIGNGGTGTILGHIGQDGSFTLIALVDGIPGNVGITCGQFQIAPNGHLVTVTFGIQEQGCNSPGWSQDLERQ